ncbi:ac110 [Malacosoma neustria nucleopolyhedrovirus]|uniref:ac110 n=1 Tax=Malacosoma neustria nuclear polyhedrosis virus TaxID=38012 RepID=UPI000E35A2E6|nr:ac110 [Malacosoma neustria nucleopolyhedrovirus]AUF81607.1 ac110 [Malacosoma neustria nucleopolyhedrovirus]
MLVYIILLIVIFCMGVWGMLVLKLNKQHVRKNVYYQYNYIPEPLVSLVKVHNLKTL